jgi:formylglycine-generating enzyme required for sulfatase activity
MGEGDERHRRLIDRNFALAAREVTVAEFRRFRDKHAYHKGLTPTEDCPVNRVSWYAAAAYCNWLSEREGIPREEWCYVPKEKDKFEAGMKMAPDYLKRTGYRLPTEAEWEHACRAGSATGWSMGDAVEVLRKYAWYATNAEDKTYPVGSLRPNDWGLFDLHGNAWEWCQDRYGLLGERGGKKVTEDKEDVKDIEDILDKHVRLLRGGAFNVHAVLVRSAGRLRDEPTYRNDYVGFRPARTFP